MKAMPRGYDDWNDEQYDELARIMAENDNHMDKIMAAGYNKRGISQKKLLGKMCTKRLLDTQMHLEGTVGLGGALKFDAAL